MSAPAIDTTLHKHIELENHIRDSITIESLSLDMGDFLREIASLFEPEDIFDKQTLEQWAEGAGYVLGPDTDYEEQRVRY